MKKMQTALAVVLLLAVSERVLASGHRVEADLISIGAAVDLYQMKTGVLPPCDAGLSALVDRPQSFPGDAPWHRILDKLPEDPWGRPYTLVVDAGLPKGYGIYGKGFDGISRTVGNDPDDYNTWSPTSRGIETSLLKRMPWLWPSVTLACILCFYLGVRTEKYWYLAEQSADGTTPKAPHPPH